MMVREVKYQPHSTDGATETHPAVQRACNLACTAAAIGAVLSPAIWVLGHHAYAGPRWYFDSAVGLAVVVAVTRWHWQRRPAPEPEWDHERELLAWAQSDWQMICEAGGLRPPLVKRIWRTETGWGYYLVISRMADHEGKPLSTTQFAEWGGYIRDLVGVGCHGVHIEPDPANGGRVVAYINYKPKPVPYRVAVTIGHEERICTTPEQTERARAEAAAWEESERKRLARAGEGARGDLLTENTALYEHLYGLTDDDLEYLRTEWPRLYERYTGEQLTDDSDATTVHHARSGPDLGLEAVLSPDVEAGNDRGEGSPTLWDAPTGPPRMWAVSAPEPTTYPEAVAEAHHEVWDALLRAPLSRGQIAAMLDADPTKVSRILRGWRDAGIVRQMGATWIATGEYATSGTVTCDGDEEEAPGA